MNTCWNFFWNEGDTIDYVNQLQQPVADQSPTNLELLFLYFSIICIFQDQMYIHFVWQPCLVVDAASKTSGRPKLLGDHQQPFADHRKPPGKRVVVGGRREVVDVILWQPVTDHRQTFADLRQPPATTPKIVVVRGRRLVVAIVWPSLKVVMVVELILKHSEISMKFPLEMVFVWLYKHAFKALNLNPPCSSKEVRNKMSNNIFYNLICFLKVSAERQRFDTKTVIFAVTRERMTQLQALQISMIFFCRWLLIEDFKKWRIQGGRIGAPPPPPIKLDQQCVFNPIFYQNA